LLSSLLSASLRTRGISPQSARWPFSRAQSSRDRRLAFLLPLLTLFAGDIFIGFHKLMPVVYASFLVNVAIGLLLRNRRTVGPIGLATLAGAIQFFLVTNFAVWALSVTYPPTRAGLLTCYIAGIPFFWNTLAGDAVYAILLFGGFALAERLVPSLREPAHAETW
jgi:hypothetical protein